jgi:hypothetical protein
MKTRQKVLLSLGVVLILLGPVVGDWAQRSSYGPVRPHEDVFDRDGRAMSGTITGLFVGIPGMILVLAGVLDLVVYRIRKPRQDQVK